MNNLFLLPNQVALLKSLYRTDIYHALEVLAKEMTNNWSSQAAESGTEWHFVRDSLTKEAKIQGVLAFLAQIEALYHSK